MRITVFHANECDRKKCTSIKMEKLGKCRLVYNINRIPSGAIVLNPYAEKAVSYEDYRFVERRGIVDLTAPGMKCQVLKNSFLYQNTTDLYHF